MVTLHASQALAIAIGVVLPIVVGLVTKSNWSGGTRAVVLAVLSGATGFLLSLKGAVDVGAAFDWGGALLTWLEVALVGIGVHFGFLKPTGASDWAKNSGVG